MTVLVQCGGTFWRIMRPIEIEKRKQWGSLTVNFPLHMQNSYTIRPTWFVIMGQVLWLVLFVITRHCGIYIYIFIYIYICVCVSINWVIIESSNGLLPAWYKSITWINSVSERFDQPIRPKYQNPYNIYKKPHSVCRSITKLFSATVSR